MSGPEYGQRPEILTHCRMRAAIKKSHRRKILSLISSTLEPQSSPNQSESGLQRHLACRHLTASAPDWKP